MSALDDVAEWEDLDAATKAKSLQTSLCDSETLFGIFCLSDVLSITLPLSKFFQKINIDLKSSQEILNDTITILQRRREKCERYFSTLYFEVCGVAEELGVDIQIPRTTTRQRNRQNYPTNDPIAYYRQSVYIPVIEFVIEDLKARFSDEILGLYDFFILFPDYEKFEDDNEEVMIELLKNTKLFLTKMKICLNCL